MLVTKTVQIEFANAGWQAVDYIQDIRNATKNASLNLYSKYSVHLEMPRIINDSQVVMDVRIPSDIVNTFSIGNHLRGVAAYLMKYCQGRYNDAVVGKRLLNYIVIPMPKLNDEVLPMEQRFNLIAEIAELLKNSDSTTNTKIAKIIEILNE